MRVFVGFTWVTHRCFGHFEYLGLMGKKLGHFLPAGSLIPLVFIATVMIALILRLVLHGMRVSRLHLINVVRRLLLRERRKKSKN